jgi:hypothetical protein
LLRDGIYQRDDFDVRFRADDGRKREHDGFQREGGAIVLGHQPTSRLWLSGGSQPGEAFHDLWMYDPLTEEWLALEVRRMRMMMITPLTDRAAL